MQYTMNDEKMKNNIQVIYFSTNVDYVDFKCCFYSLDMCNKSFSAQYPLGQHIIVESYTSSLLFSTVRFYI